MVNLRRIYYWLPPKLRLLVRKIVYSPYDLFSSAKTYNGIQLPGKSILFTGGGDFLETGKRFTEYFKKHGQLQAGERVLDIGSGMGRMAIPLTSYLNNSADYFGIDIMPNAIDWCTKNITSKFKNFRFIHIPLENDLYIKEGLPGSEVTLPFDDYSLDFIFAISVFTHLLPSEVERYFLEISRCLSAHGRLFITLFIYEDEELLLHNSFEQFKPQDHRHALMSEKVKAANVAYHWEYIKTVATNHNLSIIYKSEGSWRNNIPAEDFQDFIVISRNNF